MSMFVSLSLDDAATFAGSDLQSTLGASPGFAFSGNQ